MATATPDVVGVGAAAAAAAAGDTMTMTIPVWVPLTFLKPVFIWSFIFYVVCGLSFRAYAARRWPKALDTEANLGFKKRDTIGRWWPSLIHASAASVIATMAGLGLVSTSILTNEDVIMHSLGYFMGDLVVDRDPGYVVHHVGPIFHAEVMLRLGAHFWHTMRAGWIMEYGNVVAHTAAIYYYRKGPTFHMFNTVSFWISRPLSYYDGFMAWYADVPADVRYTWLGLIPLIAILGVYHSNTMWMIKMCRPRAAKSSSSSSQGDSSPSGGTDDEVVKPASSSSAAEKSAAPTPTPPAPSVQRVGSRKGRPQRDKDA